MQEQGLVTLTLLTTSGWEVKLGAWRTAAEAHAEGLRQCGLKTDILKGFYVGPGAVGHLGHASTPKKTGHLKLVTDNTIRRAG